MPEPMSEARLAEIEARTKSMMAWSAEHVEIGYSEIEWYAEVAVPELIAEVRRLRGSVEEIGYRVLWHRDGCASPVWNVVQETLGKDRLPNRTAAQFQEALGQP